MDYKQQIDFNKNRTFKEIFEDFTVFIKNEWQQYGMTLLICVFPFALLSAYFSTKQDFSFLFTGEEVSKTQLYLALACSFIAKFAGIFVTSAYVILYMNNERTDLDTILQFCKRMFLVALTAITFMVITLYMGFMLFIIPGLLLLPPLSLIVFDALLQRQPIMISFLRCIQFCKTNPGLSFGTIYACYGAVFLIVIIFSSCISVGNNSLAIIITSLLSTICEVITIPCILLYFSLANQNQRI